MRETNNSEVASISGNPVTFPNGQVFEIRSRHSNKCLDVSNASLENGAAVQQWTCNDSNAQRFRLQADGASYKIINVNSGKSLDVKNVSTADGAVVYQWHPVLVAHQRAKFYASTAGSYKIRFDHSSKCLDAGVSTADGAKSYQWTCASAANQEFSVVAKGGTLPSAFSVSVASLEVKNSSNLAPRKGDSIQLRLSLRNNSSTAGNVKVTPYITSSRFSDFSNVNLGTFEVSLKGGETLVATTSLPTFFPDHGGNGKEYALNSGDYSIRYDLEGSGMARKEAKNFPGSSFSILNSHHVLTAVFWHQSYFDKVKFTGGVQKWMTDTFSRKGEINNGTSTVKASPKGFDEMMGLKHHFRTFEGFRFNTSADFSGGGILNQVEDYAKVRLGLPGRFAGTGCDSLTHTSNHGFDMAIGLSNEGFGGVAWMCGNVQASGVFDGDPSVGRSQMLVIHESGHNFGAPHCDPIQGFIMCSGEKHAKYAQDGSFVWHTQSFDAMVKGKQNRLALASPSTSANGALSLAASVDGSMSRPEVISCEHEH